MVGVWVFAGLFALFIFWMIVQKRRAGPRQLPDRVLQRGRPILQAMPGDPGPGWQELGSRTTAKGLNLRFDHDDDPQARATLLAPREPKANAKNTLANTLTVRLSDRFETHHVHTGGYVFRIRLRGTGTVVGKDVRVQMVVSGDGRPYGGRVENDDNTNAAVGDWVEVESAEILQVSRR